MCYYMLSIYCDLYIGVKVIPYRLWQESYWVRNHPLVTSVIVYPVYHPSIYNILVGSSVRSESLKGVDTPVCMIL